MTMPESEKTIRATSKCVANEILRQCVVPVKYSAERCQEISIFKESRTRNQTPMYDTTFLGPKPSRAIDHVSAATSQEHDGACHDQRNLSRRDKPALSFPMPNKRSKEIQTSNPGEARTVSSSWRLASVVDMRSVVADGGDQNDHGRGGRWGSFPSESSHHNNIMRWMEGTIFLSGVN